MDNFTARANATWRRFQDSARRRWWLFVVLWGALELLGTRVVEVADAVVASVNASGVIEDVIRGVIGPLGVLAAVIGVLAIHAYWDVTRHPRVDWFEDEWSKLDQAAHWDEVQGLVRTVGTEVAEAVSRPEPMTGRTLAMLRARVDSMDMRAAAYSDMWGVGQFWTDRQQWRPSPSNGSLPPWSIPLLERVNFASMWIHSHSPRVPYKVPSAGSIPGDYGSWEGDYGSWDGARGDYGSWDGTRGDYGSWDGTRSR